MELRQWPRLYGEGIADARSFCFPLSAVLDRLIQPKRAATSFMLFSSANRSKIKEHNPDMDVSQQAQPIGVAVISSFRSLSTRSMLTVPGCRSLLITASLCSRVVGVSR